MRGKTHAIRLSRLLLLSWPKSLIVGVVASYSLGTPKVGLAADGQDSVDGKRPVVLIAMDGAGTCFKNHAGQIAPADISLATTMHKTVAEIQSKGLSGDVSIIHSCLLLDGKSGAYSTTLGEPTVLEDVQLDDLLPQIAARVNALHDPQVVMKGFSYGGWLALKLPIWRSKSPTTETFQVWVSLDVKSGRCLHVMTGFHLPLQRMGRLLR